MLAASRVGHLTEETMGARERPKDARPTHGSDSPGPSPLPAGSQPSAVTLPPRGTPSMCSTGNVSATLPAAAAGVGAAAAAAAAAGIA